MNAIPMIAHALCLAQSAPAAQAPGTLGEVFAARIEDRRAALVELRRDLHRHPEVSGQEERTAGIVAARLRELGFDVREKVGGHGVVATLRGGRPGPVIAFRADMDAVYSDAPDPVDFRSEEPGKRHICGHDVHTTIGLALAEGFAAVRAELAGTLKLVFQPAEEDGTGARAMLAEGALEEPRPVAIFAVHTAPFEVGTFATAERALMAGRDRVTLTVDGSGDAEHAARELSRQIEALATVTPERALQLSPVDAVAIQARVERASDERWRVRASVSTASAEARARVRAEVERLAQEKTSASLEIGVAYDERWLAGVNNDPARVRAACASIRALLGPDAVVMLDQVVPAFSEDFGSFQDVVPGAMFFLGVSNASKGIVGMPHSPGYVADEEAIFIGARAMAAVIFDALK